MSGSHSRRIPLGESLLAAGLVSEDQLRIALLEQGRSRLPIGKQLLALGFVDEAALLAALAENLGEQWVDLGHTSIDPVALQLLPREVAERQRVLPIAFDPSSRRLTLAVADSRDLVGMDRLRSLVPPGIELTCLLARESDIEFAIDRHYGHELAIDGILREIEDGGQPALGNTIVQPVVRLVDAILGDAVKNDASDIHFEPDAACLRIRYRIDGLLRQIRVLHKSAWAAMSVRLKVMSGMNIAEMRAPQDGRFSLELCGRTIDFRASSHPVMHGENIVLRILDRQRGIVRLEALGLAEDQLLQLERMIARPEGIILATGPTGSGKTTTLYSLLNHINGESVHIMTLEDPVEYPLPWVRQSSVAETAKLDFASGIRSMMRQDPDAILVGEIRDADTAALAFRAAMTGHRVFSTLHSNSALGALPRLADIGVPAHVLAGNIIGIIAQRLVRRLCEYCRRSTAPDDHELHLLGGNGSAPVLLNRPVGCERCAYRGYRGRLAIMELLRVDDQIDDLIAARGSLRQIRELASRRGFRSLADDGLRRVREGVTTLAELARVVDLSDRC